MGKSEWLSRAGDCKVPIPRRFAEDIFRMHESNVLECIKDEEGLAYLKDSKFNDDLREFEDRLRDGTERAKQDGKDFNVRMAEIGMPPPNYLRESSRLAMNDMSVIDEISASAKSLGFQVPAGFSGDTLADAIRNSLLSVPFPKGRNLLRKN